jgi:hypothetical protein
MDPMTASAIVRWERDARRLDKGSVQDPPMPLESPALRPEDDRGAACGHLCYRAAHDVPSEA